MGTKLIKAERKRNKGETRKKKASGARQRQKNKNKNKNKCKSKQKRSDPILRKKKQETKLCKDWGPMTGQALLPLPYSDI
jgi:hypothetical protein